MGLIDGIIQPVFSNFHSVLMSPVHFLQKPARWFKAITRFGATYSGAPNFAFDFCVERIKDEELAAVDLSKLRCLYSGSETIRYQTVRRFVERFSAVGFSEKKLFTCYGLAEATLAVTGSKVASEPNVIRVDENCLRQNQVVSSADKPFVELVGCGKTFGDTNLKIVNPDTLTECAEKEIGEIWVSGKSVAAGYLDKFEATRQTFVERFGARFLRTGDLGFTLEKELFVTGRIKDLIIIRGKNHCPQDIEQTTFFSHHALQANSCAAFSTVVGDEEKLIVVQEVKRSFLRAVDYENIFSCIMSGISRNHELFPHDIVLISPNTLPKTTSGKIQRQRCRDLWHSQNLNSLANLKESAAPPLI
jgi:acyl-CoA synthetase (AMP-forming)/AMP-acid ligase II